MYVYTIHGESTPDSYDYAAAVASIQGIVNREGPTLYVIAQGKGKSQYWLDTLSQEGGWLSKKQRVPVNDLDALVKLAGSRLKGAVIWDPTIPATFNIATTIAGIKDAIILSPEFAQAHLSKWNLPVVDDLRGRFDGSITGSKKNDAYRWAIREYIAKGLCSSHLLCLFEDSAASRGNDDRGYVITRDWAVKNRSFVFDLSVWADEPPEDDPNQPLGTDLETYKMVLQETFNQAAGKHMTELSGFFSCWKYANHEQHISKHDPVPTEWETVYLISPYNVYQNTISSDCYNQSFHCHAAFTPLTQQRPKSLEAVKDKIYLCIFMADYDSTTPLYDFMPKFWDDPNRGKIPLAWGINPNLLETYPDVISHYYKTATHNDVFTSDASAAGYINPNRIQPEFLPLFVEHNKKFFGLADMTIAPMVLDWEAPKDMVKDAFTQFSPDGYATIVMDLHKDPNEWLLPKNYIAHVWKNMPVVELVNDACYIPDTQKSADEIYKALAKRGLNKPNFYIIRIVWTTPSDIIKTLNILRKDHPDLDFAVVDIYNFFSLFKDYWQTQPK